MCYAHKVLLTGVKTGYTVVIATVLIAVGAVLSPTSAAAAGRDGDDVEVLRRWLSSSAGTADYGAAGPELPETISTCLRLLSPPAAEAAVDRALALLTAEMTGFAEAYPPASLAELQLYVGQVYTYRLRDYDAAVPPLSAAYRAYAADDARADGDYFAAADALAEAQLWRHDAGALLAVAGEAHRRAIVAGREDQRLAFARWLGKGFMLEYAYADAERYYGEAVRIAETSGERVDRFATHLDLGAYYQQAKKPARALAPLGRALAEALPAGEEEAVANLWLGLTHSQLGRLDTAVTRLTRARELFDGLDNADKRVHVRFELARAFRRRGQPARAVGLVDSAMALTAGWTTVYHRLFRHDELSSAYADLGRYDSAYHHLGAHVRLRTTLDSASHDREVRALAERYAGERETAVLEAQASWVRERQRYRWALAGVAAVGLVLGLVLSRLATRRKSAR